MIRVDPKYDFMVFHKQTMQEHPEISIDETYYFDFDEDCVYMYPNSSFGYMITHNRDGVFKMKSSVLVSKIAKWFGKEKESFLMTIEKTPKENAEHEQEWILRIKK